MKYQVRCVATSENSRQVGYSQYTVVHNKLEDRDKFVVQGDGFQKLALTVYFFSSK